MAEFVHVDPTENPDQANAMVAAILSEDAPSNDPEPKPMLEPPLDSLVELPGSGQKVEIRELTGADEEELAKVQNRPWARWFTTMLERAVVSVDGEMPLYTVGRMLVGDRDFLLLMIRRITWGPEIELSDIVCAGCQATIEATVDVGDIPIQGLPNAEAAQFIVDLRNGRKASVRLPNGNDQAVYMDGADMTSAHRNTLLLQRCVDKITDSAGVEMPVEGFPSLILDLSIPDRRRILREISKRMPGPQYDEVTVKHDDCGEKTAVVIGPVALFPDLFLS